MTNLTFNSALPGNSQPPIVPRATPAKKNLSIQIRAEWINFPRGQSNGIGLNLNYSCLVFISGAQPISVPVLFESDTRSRSQLMFSATPNRAPLPEQDRGDDTWTESEERFGSPRLYHD